MRKVVININCIVVICKICFIRVFDIVIFVLIRYGIDVYYGFLIEVYINLVVIFIEFYIIIIFVIINFIDIIFFILVRIGKIFFKVVVIFDFCIFR